MPVQIVEYPPDTRIIRDVKGYFQDDNHADTGSFIRSVTLATPRICTKSLDWLLERTDEELERAAELCDAQVVPHEWGIVRNARRKRTPWQLGSTLLVAKVDRIIPVEPVPEVAKEKMIEGTMGYFSFGLQRSLHRYDLADIHERQFVYGINGNTERSADTNPDPTFHLTDIEPRFRIT